jgi:hypothetical protein
MLAVRLNDRRKQGLGQCTGQVPIRARELDAQWGGRFGIDHIHAENVAELASRSPDQTIVVYQL